MKVNNKFAIGSMVTLTHDCNEVKIVWQIIEIRVTVGGLFYSLASFGFDMYTAYENELTLHNGTP